MQGTLRALGFSLQLAVLLTAGHMRFHVTGNGRNRAPPYVAPIVHGNYSTPEILRGARLPPSAVVLGRLGFWGICG